MVRLRRDTRLVTRALLLSALAAVCALALAAPAGAAKTRSYGFGITGASLSEVMTFHGDGGPACQRAGLCDYSGTVSYTFDHADGVAGFVIHGRRATGFGSMFFGGLTSATVQGPGGGQPCTDKILHTFDDFEVRGTAGKIRLVFHPPIDAPDFLDTYCAGPSDLDMSHANVIPEITLSERMLRRKKLLVQVSDTLPFHSGPFEGTMAFSASIRLHRSREVSNLLQLLGIG
jgi:hypothetical protein